LTVARNTLGSNGTFFAFFVMAVALCQRPTLRTETISHLLWLHEINQKFGRSESSVSQMPKNGGISGLMADIKIQVA
jgi:hypothetical protein